MEQNRQRRALVIMGMHRSGTSMTSGLFKILGFNLGSSLFPPLQDNTKGFFENIPITLLNDRLLKVIGCNWHDTYLVRKEWWKGSLLKDFEDELRTIIVHQFDESDQLLFKDPRLSILLPFYLNVFDSLGIEPSFIVCLRNPYEVAASLESRNHFATEKSVLLWMDYMLKAEFHTRHYSRTFILFDDLVKDPLSTIIHVLHKTQNDILLSSILKKQILEFVDKDLKHHNFSYIPFQHPFIPEITGLYDELVRKKAENLREKEFESIDNISTSFYNKMNFFQAVSSEIHAKLLVIQVTGLITYIRLPVVLGVNRLVFNVRKFNDISTIRFIPANCRLGLQIQDIEIIDQNNEKIKMNEFLTLEDIYNFNWEKRSINDLLFFSNQIPEISLNMDVLPILESITFVINYYAFGESVLKMKYYNSDNEINH